jgi:ribonuclease BN (tRNA processing enzyme)
VRHVFLTHEHMDHLASLPILLENDYDQGPDCIELLASSRVLDVVRRDLFNGRIWPDFFQLSVATDAFVKATRLVEGQPVERAGLSVTPLAVNHCVETFGMVVDDGHAAVAFPSDTGPTDAFWRHLALLPRLDAVFLEVSFPNAHAELARQTGHHSPATFAEEVAKLSRTVRWIVVHRKARYADEIASELASLDLPDVELAEPGRIYRFGDGREGLDAPRR